MNRLGTCMNCLTPLAGPYCHACGQRAAGPESLYLRPLVNEAWRKAVALDSRTGRRLANLFRPGRLTAEYVSGRRQPYLGPVKLYVLCAAIFFLGAPYAGFTLESLTAREGLEWLDRLVAARTEARDMERGRFADRFNLRLQTVYTVLLSLSVCGAALVLRLLHRRPFGVHVIFAIHYVSFLYLAALVLGILWTRWPAPPLLTFLLTYGLIGPYLVLALRRVYHERLGVALLRTLTLAVFSLIFDTLVNLAAVLLTLRLV